jgi:hypothetical protein
MIPKKSAPHLMPGVAPALAATRTQILYWTYLGAALSRRKLTGARLDRLVAELKAIGLGGPPPAAPNRVVSK